MKENENDRSMCNVQIRILSKQRTEQVIAVNDVDQNRCLSVEKKTRIRESEQVRLSAVDNDECSQIVDDR